ncbi:transcriptional regulator [Arthrobacter sp. zg-Y820]|uniref:transcriptional regulator n=1 Tax=unclassified Arthrobacter TaxID=235627 RepID=UPI001E307267|nr:MULTISPECIES: transcriptional regulator [unclassified Arthrobacter]MCC9197010.1 transcriptional regulator [Arthrobacter sp. zg-Y820]MDK1279875.1 transcriptional regulator [Arthrobacter sp. zg.Y820]MDK1360021.1 transcriptional regulator [Arthrobacter sp. zg-Y1219]WIB09180.1 transcriptional regulator [Arthrobacter sp. zg-Y820]
MPELDPVIHAESRLRALTTLNEVGELNRIAFTKLRGMLDMTAGNLSTHLRKLEDAGYVEITKTIEGRTPVTYVGISAEGRLAYLQYRKALRDLLAGLTQDGRSLPLEAP